MEHEPPSEALMRTSLQITRVQMAWMQARARRKGRSSLASVIRELIDDAMDADQPCEKVAS